MTVSVKFRLSGCAIYRLARGRGPQQIHDLLVEAVHYAASRQVDVDDNFLSSNLLGQSYYLSRALVNGICISVT